MSATRARVAEPPLAPSRLPPLVRAGFAAIVVLLVLVALLRVGRAWPREAHLGYAEGIWSALAIDTAHGVFYRPLQGPLGYGGTRYFPLFFSLDAGLIRLGLAPVAAGYALAAISIGLLLTGVALLVRAAGGRWWLAVAAAALALGCQPVQMALLTIRGDALPAALALLGLAATADGRYRRLAPWCFVLAFAAKPTSVYAPAAAWVLLLATGNRRAAWRLALETGAGMVAVVGVTTVVSHGRFLSVLSASAAGGSTLGSLVAAPLSFGRILRRVPESAFFIQLAAAAILTRLTRLATIERVAFLAALAVTVAIYASPATVENHLIDLAALAIVVLCCWAAREPQWTAWIVALSLVGGLASATAALWRFRTEDVRDLRPGRQAAISAVADAWPSVLVEQPMLAADANEPAYLLDPYIFSLRIARDPAALDQLVADLDRRRFGAVILEQASLETAIAETFPGAAGVRFAAALTRDYRLDRLVDGRAIYRPR